MFLTFAPLYGLVLIANLAPAGRVWRVLSLVLAAGINALLLFGGIGLAIAGPQVGASVDALPAGADLRSFGILLAVTGAIALLFMVPRVQQWLYPRLRWNLEPDNAVHAIAVQLALWAIGGNLASILLTRSVAAGALTENVNPVSLTTLWEQGIIFVFMAILGVGFGLRRGWTETRERLGIGGLSIPQLLLLPVVVIGLVLIQGGIGYLWQLTDPASLARINELSGMLFSASTMTVTGAFTIGLSAGIGEELLMRGAVQPRFGILFTTLLFTVLHTQYEFSIATLIVLALGFVLGLVRHYFNTTACILIHAGYNTLIVLASLAAESLLT